MGKRYRYSTSEKSFLDVRHDALWNDGVEWIYRNYPKITPNQLTLMGGLPVILIILLQVFGILGSITFPLLSIAIVWYLNMDAMDGKLARLSNRSSPVGQVLDHGLDALIGSLLSVTVCSFLGFTNMVFYAIAASLTGLMFFQATLKEHLTGQMMMSIKFPIGRSDDTSIVISTTELLYGLSMLFFFGYFTILGDLFFCIPLGSGLIFGMIYLNNLLFRQNLHAINARSDSKHESSSSDSSSGTGSYWDPKPKNDRRSIKRGSVAARRRVYDSDMRPTDDFAGFDLFPHPEYQTDEGESDNDNNDGNDNDNDNNNGVNVSNIQSYLPRFSGIGDLKNRLGKTPYFIIVVTQIMSLILYALTVGAMYQLLMMIVYVTTITVDMIFLNTLKLDVQEKGSQILIKRFASRNVMIFSGLKIIAYIVGLFGIIIGMASSLILAFGCIVVVDMFFLIFYVIDLLDKADVVTSYLRN